MSFIPFEIEKVFFKSRVFQLLSNDKVNRKLTNLCLLVFAHVLRHCPMIVRTSKLCDTMIIIPVSEYSYCK